MIGAIVGKPNLDNFLTFTVRKGEPNQAVISIGAVLTQIISLIIVGSGAVHVIVKAYNKMRKPADAAGSDEIELLTEIRDELRSRDLIAARTIYAR